MCWPIVQENGDWDQAGVFALCQRYPYASRMVGMRLERSFKSEWGCEERETADRDNLFQTSCFKIKKTPSCYSECPQGQAKGFLQMVTDTIEVPRLCGPRIIPMESCLRRTVKAFSQAEMMLENWMLACAPATEPAEATCPFACPVSQLTTRLTVSPF